MRFLVESIPVLMEPFDVATSLGCLKVEFDARRDAIHYRDDVEIGVIIWSQWYYLVPSGSKLLRQLAVLLPRPGRTTSNGSSDGVVAFLLASNVPSPIAPVPEPYVDKYLGNSEELRMDVGDGGRQGISLTLGERAPMNNFVERHFAATDRIDRLTRLMRAQSKGVR